MYAMNTNKSINIGLQTLVVYYKKSQDRVHGLFSALIGLHIYTVYISLYRVGHKPLQLFVNTKESNSNTVYLL